MVFVRIKRDEDLFFKMITPIRCILMLCDGFLCFHMGNHVKRRKSTIRGLALPLISAWGQANRDDGTGSPRPYARLWTEGNIIEVFGFYVTIIHAKFVNFSPFPLNQLRNPYNDFTVGEECFFGSSCALIPWARDVVWGISSVSMCALGFFLTYTIGMPPTPLKL